MLKTLKAFNACTMDNKNYPKKILDLIRIQKTETGFRITATNKHVLLTCHFDELLPDAWKELHETILNDYQFDIGDNIQSGLLCIDKRKSKRLNLSVFTPDDKFDDEKYGAFPDDKIIMKSINNGRKLTPGNNQPYPIMSFSVLNTISQVYKHLDYAKEAYYKPDAWGKDDQPTYKNIHDFFEMIAMPIVPYKK